MSASIGPHRAIRAAHVVIVTLALSSTPARAQPHGTISGTVFDQATKMGLEGAEVQLVGTKRHTITGANVGSSRVDLQACKLEYSIVSPK